MENILKVAIILVHFRKDNLKKLLLKLKANNKNLYESIVSNLQCATSLVQFARNSIQVEVKSVDDTIKSEADMAKNHEQVHDPVYSELIEITSSSRNSEIYFKRYED